MQIYGIKGKSHPLPNPLPPDGRGGRLLNAAVTAFQCRIEAIMDLEYRNATRSSEKIEIGFQTASFSYSNPIPSPVWRGKVRMGVACKYTE